MRLIWVTISFLLPHVWYSTTTAFVYKWTKGVTAKEGDLLISHNLVAVGKNGQNSTEFRNHAQKFFNMSVDEKCERGLDLSVAFLMYTPYVDVKHNRKYVLIK